MKLKMQIVVTIIVIGHLAAPIATTHAGGITPVPKIVAVTENSTVVADTRGGDPNVIFRDSGRQAAVGITGLGYRDLAINRNGANPGDFVGTRIYIADAGTGLDTGRILRLTIEADPSPNTLTVMFENLPSPSGVGFDLGTELIYWSDDFLGTIFVTSDNGCTAPACVEAPFLAGLLSPANVRVCSSADFKCGNPDTIYWTEAATGSIQHAALIAPVALPVVTGLSAPVGLSIGGNKIYWTDPGTGEIGRADLIGLNSNKQASFVLNVTNSVGIGIGFQGGNPQSMAWTLTVAELLKTRRINNNNGQGNPFGDPNPGPVTGIRVLRPPGLVPTVSTWGAVVMMLLMLAAGTIAIRHMRATTS